MDLRPRPKGTRGLKFFCENVKIVFGSGSEGGVMVWKPVECRVQVIRW